MKPKNRNSKKKSAKSTLKQVSKSSKSLKLTKKDVAIAVSDKTSAILKSTPELLQKPTLSLRSAKSVYETLRTIKEPEVSPKKQKSTPSRKLDSKSKAKSSPIKSQIVKKSNKQDTTTDSTDADTTLNVTVDEHVDTETLDLEKCPAESTTWNSDKSNEAPHPVFCTLTQLESIILDDHSALVFMPLHTSLYFKGKFRITVLSGTAEILGFSMRESLEKMYEAFSPRGYSLLCVRACEMSDHKGNLKPALVSHLQKWRHLNMTIIKQKLEYNIMLLLERLDDPVLVAASQSGAVSLLRREPCVPQNMDQVEQDALQKLCETLDCSFILRGMNFKARYYQQPNFWSSYANELVRQVSRSEEVRLAICGGKGVGKSTFLRYMINQFLGQVGPVLVIDLDPGQAEFTPAGCVSVTLVEQPLLGPNFTHLQKPLYMHVIGDVDITTCPDHYADSCTRLIEYCAADASLLQYPWVVNTMGFNTGIGMELILDILRVLQPSHVIQLTSRSAKRNFSALLDSDFVQNSPRGWKTHPDPHQKCVFEFTTFPSCAEHSDRCTEEWGLRPSELRDIVLSCYFLRTLSTHSAGHLLAVAPYKISWSSLYLCISLEFGNPSLTLAALSGSVVAMCTVDEEVALQTDQYKAEEPGYPTVLGQLPIVPCLGYGLVRALDFASRLIYVVTPEPVERLSNVNCLVAGGIHLPEKFLLQGLPDSMSEDSERVQIPYVAKGASSFQPSCQPYRRHNPPRHLN